MFSTVDEPDHRRQLRASVDDFVKRETTTGDVRKALEMSDGFSPERWQAMAELGWTAVLVPEEAGGLGLEHGDMAALHHEIGRGVLPEPLVVVPLLAGRAIVLGDNESLKENVLPELVAGTRIATLAWQGGAGGLGAEDVGPVAAREGDGWRLSGRADFVPLPESAQAMAVAARSDDGVVLLWVEGAPPSDIATHTDGSRFGSVTFDEKVSADSVIAGPDKGAAILEDVLDTARLAISAELLGVMERAFEMTVDYIKQRNQFGKPIASFQALQHRAVDVYLQIELARSAVLRAVAAFEKGASPQERAAWVSAAKSRCGDAAALVSRQGIQLHGAVGYTEEYDLSLYVKRALGLSAWLGNSRAHRSRYFRLQKAAGV